MPDALPLRPVVRLATSVDSDERLLDCERGQEPVAMGPPESVSPHLARTVLSYLVHVERGQVDPFALTGFDDERVAGVAFRVAGHSVERHRVPVLLRRGVIGHGH